MVKIGIQIDQLSETRKAILTGIKKEGSTTIAELSSQLNMTKEAVRKHLIQLRAEGWVKKNAKRHLGRWNGRPSKYYSLTLDGEHLFPKDYDTLTVEVIDKIADEIGFDGLIKILGSMTNARVKEWEPKLQGLSLEQKLEKLKGFYLKNDQYMKISMSENSISLVEENCPFLNVAMNRPKLCSVTVSTLSRLLGYRVIREEQFQNGDGRCVFRVLLDQPIDEDFDFELEEESEFIS